MTHFTPIPILACALALTLGAGGLAAPHPPPGSTVYTVAKGETIADVAARFLGDAKCVTELLNYNGISNPLTVREGTLLAIPGEQRTKALTAFDVAEKAVAEAQQAEASVYAKEAFDAATRSLAAARTAWKATAYTKAEGLCLLAAEHAREAVKQAEKNARVDRECVATSVSGHCSVMVKPGNAWRPVRLKERLPVCATVRTARGGRLELTFPDETTVQIMENAETTISELVEDRRTGSLTLRLRLVLGEIFTRMKKRKTEDSVYEIRSGESTTAIRGTDLRLGRSREDITRVMTLKGEVATSTPDGEVNIPAGNGLVYTAGKGPVVVPLPPVPDVLLPTQAAFQTARQKIGFEWKAPDDEGGRGRWGRGKAEKTSAAIEIATDEEFNLVVWHTLVNATHAESDVLPPGDYRWRLAAVTGDGLQGPWTETGRFTIRKAMGVNIFPDGKTLEHNGRKLTTGATIFKANAVQVDSSVVSIEYSVNGSPYRGAKDGIRLTTSGRHTIRARGVALDGTCGPETECVVDIDALPPRIDIHLTELPRDKSGQTLTRVVLNASDDTGVEILEYRLGDAPYRAYVAPLVFKGNQQYTLEVRSSDMVGNRTSRRYVTFHVDDSE